MKDTYLYGVSAVASGDVWAVGAYLEAPSRAVAVHWDGHSWTAVPPRELGSGDERVLAVSADSPTDVWADGYWSNDQRFIRMYQRWDGAGWSRHVP